MSARNQRMDDASLPSAQSRIQGTHRCVTPEAIVPVGLARVAALRIPQVADEQSNDLFWRLRPAWITQFSFELLAVSVRIEEAVKHLDNWRSRGSCPQFSQRYCRRIVHNKSRQPDFAHLLGDSPQCWGHLGRAQ